MLKYQYKTVPFVLKDIKQGTYVFALSNINLKCELNQPTIKHNYKLAITNITF